MTTIKEVAKEARVSIATVSAVVNGNKFVSEELRQRTEEAIVKLGYRPNRSARSLKIKKTNLLGLMVTELTNPFYPLLVKGVEELAYQNQYNVIISTTYDLQHKEEKLLDSMIEQGVDGLMLSTIDHKDSNILKKVEELKIPHVLINRSPVGYEGTSVSVDSIEVGRIAADHLLTLGHKEFAFVGGSRTNSIDRREGFLQEIKSAGLSPNSIIEIHGDYDEDLTYKLTIKMLKKSTNRPTAIFAASDTMAFAVARAYLDFGLSIPQDVSLIGSDNVSYASDFRIPLTTVDCKAAHIGEQGMKFLHQWILSGENYVHTQKIVEPTLIARQSTRDIR